MTIVDSLRQHARERGADRAFVFLDDRDVVRDVTVSYSELDAAARRIAAAVVRRGGAGRPVLLLYPPGRAYVEGFLGCLYAGAIAVPAYPPDPARPARTLPRLRALVADCGATLALGVSWLVDAVPVLLADAPELAALEWIATDTVPDDPSWTPPPVDASAPSAPAMVQYTSGSTGTPKGVVLSHANLVHNAELVRLGFGSSPSEIGVSWLPPYHDMGLIGGILQPIYTRMPTVLMSPLDFLRRPAVWLETISRFGATMSGGPNFAFDLCVRKTTPEQREQLDLSRWVVAFCGAEPVRAATLQRFAAAFGPSGFRREAFYPCYGLAEATLIVTGGRADAPPRLVRHAASGTTHVGCGTALGDQRVVIVDPDTGAECPPGLVGEVRVSGGSVARGYWNRPVETAETFGGGRLRTGDLGFLDADGELVITGRAKDVIIVRGRNVYPQDLEYAVERDVAAVRPGCSAAFALEWEGAERVAFACEVTGLDGPVTGSGATDGETVGGPSAARPVDGGVIEGGPTAAGAVAAVRQALAEAAEVGAAAVVLLRPRTIPKTSSGKIRRGACRDAFADGTWVAGHPDVIARWTEAAAPAGDGAAEPTDLVGHIAGVLGISPAEVSPGEPLTRLGLDSLRAVELRHVLDERLGLDVPVSSLLSGITTAELTRRGHRADEADDADATTHGVDATAGAAGNPADARADGDPDRRPSTGVSEGQRALWFLQRFAPDSSAYQITRAARIRSPLDEDALAAALRTLVRRHPALRSSLPSERGEPVPRLLDGDAWPALRRHDTSALDEDALRRLVCEDARRRFDLERGPLFRVSLYSGAPDDHVLLLSVHHAVSDFWSLSVLVDELLTLYRGGGTDDSGADGADGAGGDSAGSTGPRPTRDLDRRLDHWRTALAGAPAALELPTTFPRPRVQSFRGAAHPFRVDAATLRALDDLARDTGTTRFVTLVAAFAALLARYTGDDLVIGTPTAGRDDRADARVLGYLVNPVPLRVRVPRGVSLRALVGEVRATVLDALDNAVPFPRLVEAVRPARDPGRSPVMQTMLALQQAPPGRPDLGAFAVSDETAVVRLGELSVTPYRLADDGAAFDLSLVLAEVDGGLTGTVEYCADLFDGPAVARIADQFTTLLAAALADPDAPLDGVDLLDDAELTTVLAMADGGTHPAPTAEATPMPKPAPDPDASLPELFARQVARRPDADAVVDGDTVLSYAELHRRAGRLAALLRDRFAVRRGQLVGVCVPRHLDAVVAFWAVLRAGGAYLPLEPELPPARLAWLVGDARPVVVLTHREVSARLPADGPPLVHLDEDQPGEDRPTGDPATDKGTHADDLAYVLYTSGSTGRPKGVLVPHRGAANVTRAEAAALGLTEDDRVLQYASCAYDVSVDEIVMTHLHGATLVITPRSATVPGPELVRLLAERRVTTLALSPSALAALPDAELPELTKLLLGGEACPTELVTRWAPGRRFVNAYGPTETTICVTLTECRAVDAVARPPIGRPIPHVRTYVLDERMRPVPVGVPGELYAGGVCVAWGYLGRPGLTAERFVPDPFGVAPGERLYRTGDRVRWLPDGRLDFLGRFDDQVQVRGVRVEPGEVQARLRELFAVREVAVVPRPAPGAGVELVAYLVTRGARLPVADLRAGLRAELPEPWVPAAFVHLDALPLNTSHKLDRAALPPPTPADRGVSVSGRIAPRTDLERTVARVWAGVLGAVDVGVRDHFFDELGGTSLLVTRVTSELGERLGTDVPVTHLFEHPTVETLARRLIQDATTTNGDHAGADVVPEEQAAARRQALARRTRRKGAGGG